MTAYTDQRDAAGRAVFYVLELTLDQCSNDYTSSASPSTCTASDAGDGARCYYSYATCQDRPNYAKSSQTWRFLSSHVRPQQIPAIASTWPVLYPLLAKVDQVEQEVSIFGGFTRQEKRKFQLADIAGNSGNAIVPELSPGKTGLKNSTRVGSLWRRMISLHPNYVGRTATLYQGYVTPTFATSDLKTVFKGKLSNLKIGNDGGVSLEAEDLLGDFEKKLPVKISKRNTLQTSVSKSATTVTVADASEYTDPATVSDAYVVARVKTITGKRELVKITGRNTSTNVLTVTRGQYGTTAEPWHGDEMLGTRKGTRVEEVLHYSTDDGLNGLDPVDVVQNLLDRAGIPSGDIDSASMTAAQKWIGPWKVKRTISKQVQVKKLVHELLELYQAALYIDDDRAIKIFVSRPADTSETIATVTSTDILDAGVEYDQGEDRRLTHASLAYGYTDDDDGSGDGVAIYINDEAFLSDFFGVGEENRYERALKGGRWVQSWDVEQATSACGKWAMRSQTGRERLTFLTDLRNESKLEVGAVVDVTTRYIQNEHGADRTLRCVVISRKRQTDGRFRVTVESTGAGLEDGGQDSKRYAIIGPSGMTDYDSDTAANQAAYGYLSDSNDQLGAANDREKMIP